MTYGRDEAYAAVTNFEDLNNDDENFDAPTRRGRGTSEVVSSNLGDFMQDGALAGSPAAQASMRSDCMIACSDEYTAVRRVHRACFIVAPQA
jgi:hypothetical protein